LNNIQHSHITEKLDIAIEGVLYGLLVFMPFAFGVVHAWSELIVITAAAVLIGLTGVKLFVSRQQPVLSWALIPVAVFVLVPVFQLIPLPAGMVKTLSPNTYQTKTELLSQLPSPQSSDNPAVPAEESVETASQSDSANPNLQSTIYNIQSNKMSLTFYSNATLHGLRLVLSIAVIFFVTLQYFTTTDRIKRLLSCITIVGGAVAVLVLLQNITRADSIYWSVPIPHKIAEAGPFVNHSNFGQFMNLSIGAALALILVKFHEFFTVKTRIGNRKLETGNDILLSDTADYLFSPDARWFWFTLGMIVLSVAAIFISLTRAGMIA
jgi:hypothetical protein